MQAVQSQTTAHHIPWPIVRVLVWEFLRRGRWNVPLTVSYSFLPPALLGAIGWLAPGVYHELANAVQRPLAQLFFVPFATALYTFVALQSAGDEKFRFPTFLKHLPATTRLYVTVKMALVVVAVASMFLATMAIYRFLFGIDWEIIWPTLYAATVAASMLAACWSLCDFGFKKVGGALVIGSAFFFRALLHYGQLSNEADLPWFFDVLVMSVTVMGAYFVSLAAIARSRCGEDRPWPNLTQWWLRRRSAKTQPGSPFASAEQAQLWLDWRRLGWGAPFGVAVVLSVVGAGLFFFGKQPTRIDDWWGASLVFQTAVILLVGACTGLCGTRNSLEGIDEFYATRPLRDATMTRIRLRVGLWNVFAILLVAGFTIAAMFAYALFTGRDDLWRNFHFSIGSYRLGVFQTVLLAGVGSVVAGWTLLGLVAAMIMTGRGKVWGTVLVVMFYGPMIFMVIVKQFFPGLEEAFGMTCACLFGLAGVAGTGWLYHRAIRNGHLRISTAAVALVTWFTACIGLVAYWLTVATPDIRLVVYGIGVSTLPILPLAAAPVALAWNRHR